MTRNPFQPAARAGLLHRMEQDGCETFSDKVRWVEKHMPNIDDPAAFVGALVRGEKNPVDREYRLALGSGAFSKAYGKPDEEASFYLHNRRPIDRGPRAVETITQREEDRYPGIGSDPDSIDASKVVLIAARELLKNNKKALAYLPAIEPVRIDYTDPAAPELIFTMPVYMTVEDAIAAKRISTKNLHLANALAKLDRDYTVQENIGDFARLGRAGVFFRGSPFEGADEIKPISEVLLALSQAAKQLPFTVTEGLGRHDDVGLDLHSGNVALDAKGHLILLDPIVAVAALSDIEKYWQDKGWPGGPVSGKKLPRKAKNPPQPELFKESRRVTVTRDDLAKHRPWAQEALRLIETAYAPIGGHANLKSVDAILADDADVYRFEDLDGDQEPDVLQVSKTTPYGQKGIATGTNGTREAKRAMLMDKIEDFRQFGNYGEVSERLAKILLDAGVPVIGDKRIVEKVLNKKVDWVGLDPEFPSVYGWYERVIGGHKHRKILVGLPDVVKNPALAALRKAGAR